MSKSKSYSEYSSSEEELPPYEQTTAAAASSSADSLEDRRESSNSPPRRQYNPSGGQFNGYTSYQQQQQYNPSAGYTSYEQRGGVQQAQANGSRNKWLDAFKHDHYCNNYNYYQDERQRYMDTGMGCGGCGHIRCAPCRQHPRPGLISLGVGLVVAGKNKVEDRSQRKREQRAREASLSGQ